LICDSGLKDLRFAKFWGLEICGRDLRFTDKRFEILGGDWDLGFAHDCNISNLTNLLTS
jgi:hypothetical protein